MPAGRSTIALCAKADYAETGPSAGAVEEPSAEAGIGQRAGVVAAEQPVASVRHEIVAEVADRSRNNPERPRQSPAASELPKNPKGGVGLPEQALLRTARREDEIERVEVPRISAVAG